MHAALVRQIGEVVEKSAFRRGPDRIVEGGLWAEMRRFEEYCALPNLSRLATSFVGERPDPLDLSYGPSLRVLKYHPGLRRQKTEDGADVNVDVATMDPSGFAERLKRLSRHAPELATLNMRISSRPSRVVSTALSDLICGFSCLTDVSVIGIDALDLPRVLRHLSTCPALRSLDIFGDLCGSESCISEAEPGSLHFPALRKLYVDADTVDSLTTLLRPIACSSAITDVHVYAETSCSSSAFRRLAEVLGAIRSIQRLELVVGGTGRYHEILFCVPLPSYSPLLSLTSLRYLKIGGGSAQFSLDNAMVAEMARAWPAIQWLDLFPDPEYSQLPLGEEWYSTSVTIPGLLPFALHCPDLAYLRIPLAQITPDTLTFSDVNASSLSHRPAHRLTELAVRSGRINGPRLDRECVLGAANCLSAMFPLLELIDGDHYSPSYRDHDRWDGWLHDLLEEGWVGVAPLVDIFSRVRMQERGMRRSRRGGLAGQ